MFSTEKKLLRQTIRLPVTTQHVILEVRLYSRLVRISGEGINRTIYIRRPSIQIHTAILPTTRSSL
jgi:hypothetical protein